MKPQCDWKFNKVKEKERVLKINRTHRFDIHQDQRRIQRRKPYILPTQDLIMINQEGSNISEAYLNLR